VAAGIYLRRDGRLIEMRQQAYITEAALQELLANHPELLSGDGERRRWLLVAREFSIAAEAVAA
jgi:hypothetical protein